MQPLDPATSWLLLVVVGIPWTVGMLVLLTLGVDTALNTRLRRRRPTVRSSR